MYLVAGLSLWAIASIFAACVTGAAINLADRREPAPPSRGQASAAAAGPRA
ncbi:hypothetical protein ACDF64_10340 [Agromyces sp. MMS24-JH15]|uniref:hypothetical protein n=1 Tax=Agromyces sp. MMS24-JH15 TaxID=3243765 RepID=UPI003747DF26